MFRNLHRHGIPAAAAYLAFAVLFALGWIVAPRPGIGRDASAEEEYRALNAAAMARMMKGMQRRPTGDVDLDFVQQMTVHHQGAVDMAAALLKYGKNEKLKRLAQEIIVTQREEMAAMQLAIEAP